MQLCLGDTLHILDQEAGCFNGRFDLQMLFPFYIPNQVHSDRKKGEDAEARKSRQAADRDEDIRWTILLCWPNDKNQNT